MCLKVSETHIHTCFVRAGKGKRRSRERWEKHLENRRRNREERKGGLGGGFSYERIKRMGKDE